ALDGLDDLRVGGVHQVSYLATDILLPVGEGFDVLVDAGVGMVRAHGSDHSNSSSERVGRAEPVRARGGTRTPTPFRTPDPKSGPSASSGTLAMRYRWSEYMFSPESTPRPGPVPPRRTELPP